MANMSYCRFEHTYTDLQDCYNSLEDDGLDNLSESEREYAEMLIKLCKDLGREFDTNKEKI